MNIVHQLEVKATAKDVYEALASQEGIKGWWSKDCDVSEEVGGHSQMRFNKEGKIVEMHFLVETLNPRGKVSWTCVKNPNPAWLHTQIHFELAEQEAHTALTFTHAGWDAKWKGEAPYEMTKEGWEHFMSSLKAYCETGEGQPW